MNQDIVSRITAIAEPIARSLGTELVEVEYRREGRRMVLRLFIDREGGVTLDDCSDLSRELSHVLDAEDVIPGAFTLEVSSPGLDRPLKSERDYERYRGRLVKVKTAELFADDAGNPRKTFTGTLLGLEEGKVRIALNEGQMATIPLEKIAKANLEPEF